MRRVPAAIGAVEKQQVITYSVCVSVSVCVCARASACVRARARARVCVCVCSLRYPRDILSLPPGDNQFAVNKYYYY